MPVSRVVRAAALAAALLAVPVSPAASAHGDPPSAGSAGLGDRLFPALGNGGYDVEHYDIAFAYPAGAPSQPVTGTVTIDATATQALSAFDLDFGGTSDGAVTVDGAPAVATRDDEELVITPSAPIAKGARFRVVVAGYTATPAAVDPEDDATTAFFFTTDGTATAPQPNFAHLFLPSNDHPRDKATFTFHLTVPDGTTAVANGTLSGTTTAAGRTTWTYDMRQPMATELVQLATGDLDVTERGTQGGVLVRDVTPRRLTAALDPQLAAVTEHLPWMVGEVGAYPFDAYGSLVVDGDVPFSLETQTLSMFPMGVFAEATGLWQSTMVHELSHSWFGDSVSPWEWSDLWLNEGHATWYEVTWAEEHGFLADDTAGQLSDEGFAELEPYMRAIYAAGDQWRADFGPVAVPNELYTPNSYQGGALVLYALRQRIGADAFAALERDWVASHRYGVASTHDFIAFAARYGGPGTKPFLKRWLYGTSTPPMPGHPDWTVDPVQAPEPAPAA